MESILCTTSKDNLLDNSLSEKSNFLKICSNDLMTGGLLSGDETKVFQ